MSETRILTARWGKPDSATLASYRADGGYRALDKALAMEPAKVVERGEALQPARPRRRRLRHRPQVVLPPQGRPPPLPHGERRRVGAGHLQGPLHHGARSPPAHRGDRHHLLGQRHPPAPTSTSAASSPSRPGSSRRRWRRPGRRASSARGSCGKKDFELDIHVHRGAGAYICGEESALLESLEGKKGYPRLKPPFPAVVGLWGKPTIINNVETLANVPWIVEHGGEAFAALGTGKSGGTRLFCVSGHVNRPGVYEKPVHYNLKKLIYGGLRRDRGRAQGEGGHPRRLLGAGAGGERDRRLPRVRRPQGRRDHGRLGRHHRLRRVDLHGPRAPRASPGSTPRRAAASAPPAARAPPGWRECWRSSRPATGTATDVARLEQMAGNIMGHDHLRAGRRGRHAGAVLREEVPGRVRAPRRPSAAAPSASTPGGSTRARARRCVGDVVY